MGAEGEIAGSVDGGWVRQQLARVARRVWLTQCAYGACWWLVCVGLIGLALFLADNALHLPAAARLVIGVAATAAALRLGWTRVVGPLRSRWSPERAARMVESASGRSDNLLINACLFEGMALREDARGFAAPVLQGARVVMRATSLSSLCRLRRLGGWLAGVLAVVGLWELYHLAAPERLGNAFERFALPLADVPALGSIRLELDPATDQVLNEGGSLTVRVHASGPGTVPTPRLIWADGGRFVAADSPLGETMSMSLEQGEWQAHFADVHRSFALRVFCGDSCTRSIHIAVAPLPRLLACQVVVQAPAYVGARAETQAGPPAPLDVLPGSALRLSLRLDQPVGGVSWRIGGAVLPMTASGETWSVSASVQAAGTSELLLDDGRILASGEVIMQPDAVPQVTLSGVDDNRLLLPGTTLAVVVAASDDHGLRATGLQIRESDSGPATTLKAWQYLGPPGVLSAQERYRLVLDPADFQPGHSYILQAVAGDFSPTGQVGRSRPVVLRIKSLEDISANDPDLAAGIAALKEAIGRQREAVGLSDNLALDLDAAIQGGRLPAHQAALAAPQQQAQDAGRRAVGEFLAHDEVPSAHALQPLIEGEMPLALEQIATLPADGTAAGKLQALLSRQQDILSALISLLGEVVDKANAKAAAGHSGLSDAPQPLGNTHDAVDKALSDLQDFVREQSRLLERSRSLMDIKPMDLSDSQAAVLGELAREEAKQAKYLEEKMTDFSKIPTQDFSDASLGHEVNQVWEDVNAADAALYKKAVEMAVPQEQSGLELAKELEQNLEKWMSNHPDNVQWKMEEALAPADVPISELPKQLEDIVGDLLDKEDAMQPDVEDFSSAWMDNIDKGAGWDAGDGPISNMSAKGITGNQLPNQNEIGGRSGEGRNGRSHGQMVQDTAEGKGGRETPSRLDPEPFESGSVKDSAKDDQGGPTGGGKVSGYAQEGLRGPVPPSLAQSMVRLAGKQAEIRQAAGKLALELRRRHLPSGDVENALRAMGSLEEAASRGDGGAIHQRFTEAVDALRSQRDSVSDAPASLRHERIDLSATARDIQQGPSAGVPPGYEEMSSEYFKAMAQAQAQGPAPDTK